MTHDELTAMLRNLPSPSIGGPHQGGVQMLAANRLDQYRAALENARDVMILANQATGQGRFDITWIDEVLK